MHQKCESVEDQRRRSEFIRELVQRSFDQRGTNTLCGQPPPKTIVQFWHDLGELPPDVNECVRSWSALGATGFDHRLFDERTAGLFIASSLGMRHKRAFECCYHPAMQSDYFRLCYLLVEGGFYIDADDVYVGTDFEWLAEDGRLKLQPLCYDIASDAMVKPAVFLLSDAYDPEWIFYFNNNPLIASPWHPVIQHALERATSVLELADEDVLPEIQMATGPGNISKSIFELGTDPRFDLDSNLIVLGDWDSVAISKWPLSYRGDTRNWRLSNQKRFNDVNDPK